GDVAHLYDVSFDWRRHVRLTGSGNGLTEITRAHLLTGLGQRTHRVRHAQRKVVGLPDEEFANGDGPGCASRAPSDASTDRRRSNLRPGCAVWPGRTCCPG